MFPHSSLPSLMPSSDESVTLQTDFSFKHSLVPAIHSHLKSQSLESEAQQPVVMEMNVKTTRVRAQKLVSLARKS